MLATQLTDATYHMFSTEQFARMKPSAFIINMARGPVIDEAALLQRPETRADRRRRARRVRPGAAAGRLAALGCAQRA